MFEREAQILRTLQDYGDALLRDIADDEMCLQPTPGCNHAAWIMGHLAISADQHGTYAGAERRLEAWDAIFDMGTTPTPSMDAYPAKDELAQAWHDANTRIVAAGQSAGPDLLGQPTQGPLGETLPTVADFLAFSMTGHTATHLGQLSAWRRAIGRPKMF